MHTVHQCWAVIENPDRPGASTRLFEAWPPAVRCFGQLDGDAFDQSALLRRNPDGSVETIFDAMPIGHLPSHQRALAKAVNDAMPAWRTLACAHPAGGLK